MKLPLWWVSLVLTHVITSYSIHYTKLYEHRDDFEFILNKNNLKKYGSQGQQKLSVLVLKLSEIQIFENKIGEKPILLLDDVFSEFDKHRITSYNVCYTKLLRILQVIYLRLHKMP